MPTIPVRKYTQAMICTLYPANVTTQKRFMAHSYQNSKKIELLAQEYEARNWRLILAAAFIM